MLSVRRWFTSRRIVHHRSDREAVINRIHAKLKELFRTISEGKRKRSLQLDILRGVAVLLVLGAHSVVEPEYAGFFEPVAACWTRFGWSGVDLFFVLSGFLIGGLLFREIHRSLSFDPVRFLVRRAFKIWPAYFLYLAYLIAGLFIMYPGESVSQVLRPVLPNLLHVQNYFGTPREHTWSLAVEEHFYLVLPFVLWLAVKIGQKRGSVPKALLCVVPPLAIGLIAFCTFLRHHGVWAGPVPFVRYPQTHLRIDALFFGVFLSYVHIFRPEWLRFARDHRRLTLLAGFALISPMMICDLGKNPWIPSYGFMMLYLGYGLILMAIIYTPVNGGRLGRFLGSWFCAFLGWVGYFSYSIYLWHMDVGWRPAFRVFRMGWVALLPPTLQWLVSTLLFAALAIVLGAAVSLLVEMPMLRVRDKLFPSKLKKAG